MLLLTLCCACSREPLDGEFIDMSGYDVPCIEAEEVKHRVTEEECYGIFDVRTAEGKVIITKEFSDNLIHVIDPESGAVAATVLHLGRGPGEAVNSYYIGMSEDRSRFWAKDLALNQINIFDTRSVLQGSRQPLRTVRLNRYSGTEMDIMPVGDSIYTCSQLGGTVMRFNVYDSTGTYIRSFGTFPRLRGTAGLKDYARPSVFGGHAVYMEDCSRFAMANDCISLISIYSPEGTIISNAWGPEEVLPYIKSVTYPNSKAAHLVGTARKLVSEFGGEVPSDIGLLMSLPGVGRKTANVVASITWGEPVIAVDTHVFRVARRLGLSDGKNVREVELDLERHIPEKLRPIAHHWLILHGRYTCKAARPKCQECPLAPWCRETGN